jgi:peptide/nickel transport system permease protein
MARSEDPLLIADVSMYSRSAEVLLKSKQGPSAGAWRALFHFARTKPLGAAGAFLILLIIVTAVFAPVIAPYDPLFQDYEHRLSAPSWSYPFGTDNLGRDVLSRVMWGARPSLLVGLGAALTSTTVGAFIGLLTGFAGGKVDTVVQRVSDGVMALPGLVLTLAIVASLGPSTLNIVLAISLAGWPGPTRVIRSAVLSIRERPFVDAARAMGASPGRMVLWHVLPNCLAPYFIILSASVAGGILAEASLSFLGLGTQPPQPSWGKMLSGVGRTYANTAPWLGIFPGLAISMAVFGFNFFGDALRDIWDPRLRRGR